MSWPAPTSPCGPTVGAAVRKFVDTVDEATPALVDPARRKTIVDAALDLADSLVTTRLEFLRSVVRSTSPKLRLLE